MRFTSCQYADNTGSKSKKVKLFLCRSLTHVEGGGDWRYSTIYFNLGTKCSWLANFASRKLLPPVPNWISGWVNQRAALDALKKSHATTPCPGHYRLDYWLVSTAFVQQDAEAVIWNNVHPVGHRHHDGKWRFKSSGLLLCVSCIRHPLLETQPLLQARFLDTS